MALYWISESYLVYRWQFQSGQITSCLEGHHTTTDSYRKSNWIRREQINSVVWIACYFSGNYGRIEQRKELLCLSFYRLMGCHQWPGRMVRQRSNRNWTIKGIPTWGTALWKALGKFKWCWKVDHVDAHQKNPFTGAKGFGKWISWYTCLR